MLKRTALRAILNMLPFVIRQAARRSQIVRDKLKSRNVDLQIRLRDGSIAYYFSFKNGRVTGHKGSHPKPDCEMVFKSAAMALAIMKPGPDYAVVIDALKNFKVTAAGDDGAIVWFGHLMNLVSNSSWQYGVKLKDGARRYTNLTNGGPIHVDVKDGKIIRTIPIELQADDAPSWSVNARGKTFKPISTSFAAGNVSVVNVHGERENVIDALVELLIDENKVCTQSDHYGDFKIDGFAAKGQDYIIKVTHADWGGAECRGQLTKSMNLNVVLA